MKEVQHSNHHRSVVSHCSLVTKTKCLSSPGYQSLGQGGRKTGILPLEIMLSWGAIFLSVPELPKCFLLGRSHLATRDDHSGLYHQAGSCTAQTTAVTSMLFSSFTIRIECDPQVGCWPAGSCAGRTGTMGHLSKAPGGQEAKTPSTNAFSLSSLQAWI